MRCEFNVIVLFVSEKGLSMRIAIACDGLDVAPYSSCWSSFMCYTVERGLITKSQNVPNTCVSLASDLAPFLQELEISTFIAGEMEDDVADVLCHMGIEVLLDAHGPASDVIHAYITETLSGVNQYCRLKNLLDQKVEADRLASAAAETQETGSQDESF